MLLQSFQGKREETVEERVGAGLTELYVEFGRWEYIGSNKFI